jgi:hypothetical protein
VDLLTELLAALVLIVVVTVIHGTGVALMDKAFRHGVEAHRRKKLAKRETKVMVPMALSLFALHTAEITVFAVFYLVAGEVQTFRDALYHSALAYTTMGVIEGEISLWPMVAAFEGLAGFLLIGWSAAVFVTDMEKVLRRRD